MAIKNTHQGMAAVAAGLILAGCGAGSGSDEPAAVMMSQSASSRSMLTAPVVLEDAERLSGGIDHVVALDVRGDVYAWGNNQYGQAGMIGRTMSALPVKVAGMSAVQAVQAGSYHTAVLRTDGTVWVWGDNHTGQLGNGRIDNGSARPAKVAGLSGVRAISAGQWHSVAVTHASTVWGWGKMGGRASTVPVVVPELNGTRAIAAGADFNLAIKHDGTVWAWGANGYGQLGMGSRSALPVVTPAPIRGLDNVLSVSAGTVHSIALRRDGSVWTWGIDTYGQLGNKNGKPYAPNPVLGLPTPVNGASGVKAVAAGTFNSAVLYTDGSVWVWGSNTGGQFGNGTLVSSSTPVKVNSITDVVGLTVGDGWVTLLTSGGTLYSTGMNSRGQLGNNTTSPTKLPVQVVGLSGVGYINVGKSSGK